MTSSVVVQLMLRLSRSGWSQQMGSQDVGDSSTTALAQSKDAAWEAPFAINQRHAQMNSAVHKIAPSKPCTECTFDAWRVQPVLRDTEKEEHDVEAGQPLSSPAVTDATVADEEANEAVSVHSSSSESPTIPSAGKTVTVPPPPLQMRVIALAIVPPPLKHVQHKTKCWQQKMR